MLLHTCDECGLHGTPVRYNSTQMYALPKDWIGLTLNDLMHCTCSWECAERLSRRMVANKEHPGDDVSTDRPARVGPSMAMTELADEIAEKAAVAAACMGKR